MSLPAEFDVNFYRSSHQDLLNLDDMQLMAHYVQYGLQEGRVAFTPYNRDAFLDLIPVDATQLEIGPFLAPCLKSEQRNVKYFDVLDRAQMIARAQGLIDAGIVGKEDFEQKISEARDVHFVHPTGDLASLAGNKFEYIFSAHCGEHQPDLIKHLNGVADLLDEGGSYFMILPDHRYCFDHFLPPSRLIDIVGAHIEGRTLHSPILVLEHRLETTHNNPVDHWAGEHGTPRRVAQPELIPAALSEARTATHQYVDVHSWKFTPLGFKEIMRRLFEMGMTQLEPVRVYPTLWNGVEFFAILQKPKR